jgi:5-methylcytosine-specific restriction protein A
MIDTPRLAAELGQYLGIRVRTQAGSDKDGLYVDLSPADLPLPEGFRVHLRLMWRTVDANVVLGNYARGLLAAMASSNVTDRALFEDIAGDLASKGGNVALAVNGQDVEWKASSEWPVVWSTFGLRVRVSPVEVDQHLPENVHSLALWWGGGAMALMLSLLPMAVSAEPSRDEAPGLPEGAVARVLMNQYERNPLNRAACIMARGSRCLVCGSSLEDTYGLIARGYIQVHHLTRVAEMGADYVVHPSRDLIPVCPNCHAMMHRRTPPYSPDEVRAMLGDDRRT